jgi:hypothetical protein
MNIADVTNAAKNAAKAASEKGLFKTLKNVGGFAMKGAVPALAAIAGYEALSGLWDEGNLIGGPEWTKAGKRKKATNFALRSMADDSLTDSGNDLVEQSMSGRLADLAGMRAGPRLPASYIAAKDQSFMADMAQRYKAELQRASLNDGPSIAEIAARTGLV